MYPNWEHWRDLKGTCPVCGKPSHVGVSMRTGRYYWLHDDYDVREYYREHGKHSSLAEISFDVFQEMTHCAREHGIEPVATIGGAEAVSKRVRCIETGKEYRSIQDAADDVQRSRASLSSAIKRSGTCAGCRLAASNQVDGGCSKARKMRLRPSVFNGIDFVFAGDGNPRWRHLGFLVSGQAGNPAEKAWERVRRHPLFHAFSALALIEYQCSPAKAALRVARFGKWVLKVH